MKFIRYFTSGQTVEFLALSEIKKITIMGESMNLVTHKEEKIYLEIPDVEIDSLDFENFLNDNRICYEMYLQQRK